MLLSISPQNYILYAHYTRNYVSNSTENMAHYVVTKHKSDLAQNISEKDDCMSQ